MTKKKVLKFYGPNCGPCRIYAPTFEKVSQKLGEEIEFTSINVESVENSEIVLEYGIKSIPTTIVVHPNGDTVRKSGAISEQALENLIQA